MLKVVFHFKDYLYILFLNSCTFNKTKAHLPTLQNCSILNAPSIPKLLTWHSSTILVFSNV